MRVSVSVLLLWSLRLSVGLFVKTLTMEPAALDGRITDRIQTELDFNVGCLIVLG